jgi:D-hydroxyproline dehydrogenase subunit alpha
MTERAASVVVVGAGPAGIAAAVRAEGAGRSVILIDQAERPGGQIWRHRDRAALPRLARSWLQRLDRSAVRLLTGASVVDAEPSSRLRVDLGGRPLGVRWNDALVLATGSHERFVPFPGWTLPGVVGVGGAQALLKSGMDVAGMEVVLAGSGPLLLPVAATLSRAGANLTLVAEQAPLGRVIRFGAALWRSPSRWLDAARYRAGFLRTPYRTGTWVLRAEGEDRVREVTLTDGDGERTLSCDLLCTGFGLTPASELARLLGCATDGWRVKVDGVQATSEDGVYCAGEACGIAGAEIAILEGEIAGLAAAGDRAGAERLGRRRPNHDRFVAGLAQAFRLREELSALPAGTTLVCRCEDVPLERLRDFGSTREAKLHTRAGMGSCQGRICQPALQHFFGWGIDSVRPPLFPTSLSVLAAPEEDESPPPPTSIT